MVGVGGIDNGLGITPTHGVAWLVTLRHVQCAQCSTGWKPPSSLPWFLATEPLTASPPLSATWDTATWALTTGGKVPRWESLRLPHRRRRSHRQHAAISEPYQHDGARTPGLTASWYGDNCGCPEHNASPSMYRGNSEAIREYEFDGVKLDGCGAEYDVGLWAEAIDDTGKTSVMIENCHQEKTVPSSTWCPWNLYRSSGDIGPLYASVVKSAMPTIKLAKEGLSVPGCWAYPDCLVVGTTHWHAPGLSPTEARTNFGLWAITSSPLIL